MYFGFASANKFHSEYLSFGLLYFSCVHKDMPNIKRVPLTEQLGDPQVWEKDKGKDVKGKRGEGGLRDDLGRGPGCREGGEREGEGTGVEVIIKTCKQQLHIIIIKNSFVLFIIDYNIYFYVYMHIEYI